MRNTIKVFLFMLIIIEGIQACKLVFNYGIDSGEIIYSTHGKITTWTTNLHIPIPDNEQVSYVEFILYSLQEPTFKYDIQRKTLNITYSWYQVPLGSYDLTVKGFGIKQREF